MLTIILHLFTRLFYKCVEIINRKLCQFNMITDIFQIENKLIAVQFRQNIYLTDGWMVPDRILWFPFDSENLRPYESKRKKSNPIDEIDLDSFNLY